MSRLILIILSVLCFSAFVSASQSSPGKSARADDRVTIRARRIVIVRSPALVKQFPERKRAIITYPVVSGLSNPAVLRQVRALFDFKNIFDYSLKEYREDTWLSEFGYDVNFNGNHLLDITFNQSGMAAYPDDQSKHFLINLKNGKLIKAIDAFDSSRFDELAQLVDAQLQQELKKLQNENKSIDSQDSEEKAMQRDAYEALKFEVQNLDEFSVSARGITFLYDAGFPHVIKALEPEGRYFFSYSQLKPFIRPDGPLGQFVR